jgi:hypothetical protein
MYDGQTTGMDLIELARTIQADRKRAIVAETRRRQLLATTDAATPIAPPARPIRASQRPASTGALSR